MLQHTFDLVEGVVIDSSQIARALTGRVVAASDPDIKTTVIDWREVVLNRNGVCEECKVILPVGQRAATGVPTGPRAPLKNHPPAARRQPKKAWRYRYGNRKNA